MDVAYDHITEETLKEGAQGKADTSKPEEPQPSLNSEIQDAYKAFSNSPWGAKIGGFFGNVVKQGESVSTQLTKELTEVRQDATKGFSSLREGLITQTRGLSVSTVVQSNTWEGAKSEEETQTTPTTSRSPTTDENGQPSESMIERLKTEAAKRLKDLQAAEEAADEALIKFGGNVRNFLKDAISIAAPQANDQSGAVLFESKDAQGKRVIHTSRFDAQLHVIHTSPESFTKDAPGSEFEAWSKEFDAEEKTAEITSDLEKYPDLRATMEKLVPDQVPYLDFWRRYYFLRHGIETAEARRRDLLKAAEAEDEVAWDDDDSEDEAAPADKPEVKTESTPPAPPESTLATSSATIQPPPQTQLKPVEARKSNDEKSQADSEASYDVVGARSGMTSQAPNSPKDPKKADDSDDDWE